MKDLLKEIQKSKTNRRKLSISEDDGCMLLPLIFEHKSDLLALVVDAHFIGHKLKRSTNGRTVSAIILNKKNGIIILLHTNL
ncbi:hypothetical protein Ahy_A10g050546 [Arachis hypogaea]|uniref:Uncharacterized protein n=1 Tax=Arachis hypogaea TaxID=3818 RepID=A0A445B9N0_ARAHY|nr:hypothetical protein Ahy_A10g050546 [Arachis hypogaea]